MIKRMDKQSVGYSYMYWNKRNEPLIHAATRKYLKSIL